MDSVEAVAAPILHLDQETHEYRLHPPDLPPSWGRPLPSVTQIITEAGLVADSDYFTEESRIRGRLVHRIVMLEETVGVDESSIDHRLQGYIQSYRAFKRDIRPGPCELVETPLCDPIRGFAGTVDQVLAINGGRAVLELKSGTKSAWWGLQVAAYESLVRLALGCGPLKRYAVQLQKDGKFKLVEYQDRNDLKVFYSALAVVQWQESHR